MRRRAETERKYFISIGKRFLLLCQILLLSLPDLLFKRKQMVTKLYPIRSVQRLISCNYPWVQKYREQEPILGMR